MIYYESVCMCCKKKFKIMEGSLKYQKYKKNMGGRFSCETATRKSISRRVNICSPRFSKPRRQMKTSRLLPGGLLTCRPGSPTKIFSCRLDGVKESRQIPRQPPAPQPACRAVGMAGPDTERRAPSAHVWRRHTGALHAARSYRMSHHWHSG